MSLDQLQARVAAVNDVLCAISVLTWDSRTMMPTGGAASRGAQIATLTGLSRGLLTAPETERALEGAEREAEALGPDDPARRAVAQVRAALEHHRRIPGDLLERKAALRVTANAAWAEARRTDDFALFAPHLEATVALAREYAEAAGYEGHPYDALVRLYEPGETLASLRRFLAELREGLKPILATALAKPRPRTDFLGRDFPEERQLTLCAAFARRFGYDFSRGRLDTTVHPFEVSFTRDDVRITTRTRRDAVAPALFGAMHEAGHGLYEQNLDPALTRTVFATDLVGLYAVGGTSFGAHESQSRLWENHVGRSARFWRLHFHEVRDAFPEALGDVEAEEFAAAVSTAAPSLIRTDADELTYDVHVMLRVEIEAALIGGDLAARELPAAWAEGMRDGLGVAPANDAQGCLQDVHWSSGMIGSFCTYTIGNAMAAQLFATAKASEPSIETGLDAGDYAPLAGWLREHVWRHGRRFTRDELLTRATGEGLRVEPYLSYLRGKYA